MESSSYSNAYYICLPGRAPIPWPALDAQPALSGRTLYFSGVLRAMDDALGGGGLTVYLTWNLRELPSYGPEVVAVLLGDEWGRIPRYSHRVLAVFKTFGTSFDLLGDVLRQPSYLNFITLARYLRTQAHRLPDVLHYRKEEATRRRHGEGANIFAIPLGYANQEALPIRPPAARAYDLYFSGSIENKPYPAWYPQHWMRTPKEVSRRQMVAAIERLQRERPDLEIELDVTSRFTLRLNGQAPERAARRSYSEELMDTRICVVPRGTTAETCRFYEGLRYGCVMITEALPPRWFYDGAPVIQLDDWRELGAVVEELVGDEQRMERMHRASLRWWRERCSEEATGRFMAEQLNTLRQEQPAVRREVYALTGETVEDSR